MDLIMNDGVDISKLQVYPTRVLIRIKGEDRENVFLGREITTEDGRTIRLIKTIDCNETMDRKSTLFVREGEVLQVGEAVNNIQVGDIAVLDYKVDNDHNVTVGWIGEDKIIAPIAVTTYFENDKIEYANRLVPRDIVSQKKGEIDNISAVIGVIRNGELHAQDPYVLLRFKFASERKETLSGIIYDEREKFLDLEVLAVSDYSRRKYGIIKGSIVKILEQDTFKIDLTNEAILACDDCDVKMVMIQGSKEDALIDIMK